MPGIELESLKNFAFGPISVAIIDKQGEKAPFVQKQVKKIELCPDKTHIRIYFDSHFFIAIPLNSQLTKTHNEWSAYDEMAELYYVIQRENEKP